LGGVSLANETKKNFFSNREIWEQVFGKDGRGGAIGELHLKVDNKFDELESMICAEFKNTGLQIKEISDHLKEYNGLHPKIDSLEKTLGDHIEEWECFNAKTKTNEAIQDTLSKEHQKGVDDADRIFTKRIKIIGLYVAIVSIFVSIILRLIVF
jgi:hypothetical protein